MEPILSHTRPTQTRGCPWWLLLLALLSIGSLRAEERANPADPDQMLRLSQAAIGQSLPDLTFQNQRGEPRSLASWRGKPLLISLAYTNCYHACSITTHSLATVVAKAQTLLGKEAFHVITIGFDTPVDTPKAMDDFARQQGVTDEQWDFLSGDTETVQALMQAVGFTSFRTPNGFDHLTQVTIVDANGVIDRQVYGEIVPTPQLVEPLKELILGVTPASESPLDLLTRKARLFCTTYDPKKDAYRYDYALLAGMGVGGTTLLLVFLFFLRGRRRKKGIDHHSGQDGGFAPDPTGGSAPGPHQGDNPPGPLINQKDKPRF